MHGLNVYACDPKRSRGRQFAPGDSLTRSEFQRDRDRVIHSTAFRRLQHKTQVFLHHEGKHFRTRLTHTLEVSQIARSLARSLGLNEDLAEAIALAHDLGHTPFGHAGERALNAAMANWGGFDHNIQALRTVTILENRYADHDGMNLTWEALEGILKHNGPVAKKLLPDLAFLPATLDLEVHSFASLEAQVAAIADDIAYNAHDIDDAVRAGLIELEDMADLALLGDIVADVNKKWPGLEKSRQAHEVQRRLITQTIEDAIAASRLNIAGLAPKTVDDVRECGQTLICFSPKMADAEQDLKHFMFTKVYRSDEVMEPVVRSERIVADLFEKYFSLGGLPGEWAAHLDRLNDDHARARLIADFIAGMTDPYAIDEYARLFDARVDFG